MNVKEFVTEMQAYYGMQYPEGMRKQILAYLEPKDGDVLEVMAGLTFRRHSARWKTLPDIAFWEELWSEVDAELRLRPAPAAPLGIEERLATPEEIAAMNKTILDVARRKRAATGVKAMTFCLALFAASCSQAPVARAAWRHGELPLGVPVVAAWRVGETGMTVYRTVIRSDYSGIYEYHGAGHMMWPVEREPDYWAEEPADE